MNNLEFPALGIHFHIEDLPSQHGSLLQTAEDILSMKGAVMLGTTNSSSTPIVGVIRNPYDPELAGGSGAAVAVATGIGHVGIGVDTDGSIRVPASFCGLIGIKPRSDLILDEGM
jgi:Asp-tRNA(Asn)/Glu-tRNA(Gln) amidotransferase A subunit family amidase